MTRLPYVDPATAAPEVSATLETLPPLGLFRMVAHAATALRPWLGLGRALLSGLSLDPALRELTILQIAASTGCAYERSQHEPIAASLGVPAERVAAVAAGRLDDPSLADVADILRVVDELVRTHRTTDEAFAALRTHLDEQKVIELLLVAGHYLGISLLVAAVDLDPDPPVGIRPAPDHSEP